MSLLRILYWGLAYSVGLISITAVFFRYFQARDEYALKLAAYLVPFGISVASLAFMEAYPLSSFGSKLFGQVALVGGSLVVVTFPAYALGFDDVRNRRRIASVLRSLGFILAAANAAALILPTVVQTGLRFLTFIVLGSTIFIGMSWIARSDRHLIGKQRPFSMGMLAILFSLVIVLDFFRELIPALPSAELRYFFFPAFYAYLNIFLLYSHVTVWARRIAGGEASAEPAAETLKRYGVSSREAEVLSHLARGRTYREIADSLCVSLATIKTHVSHLYEKTDTRNKVELINRLYDSAGNPQNQPNAR